MAEMPSPEAPRPREVPSVSARPADWLRLLRPRQWTKNLLLFAALIFARKLTDPGAVLLALAGFAAFCVTSSAVYVLNDLLDAERDRLHPRKRGRPIASGAVGRGPAAALAAVLAAFGLAAAYGLGPGFALCAASYLGINTLYSTLAKNVAVLDFLLVASGFVIRAIAGAEVISVPYSEWFILCTLFLAIFLSASKRKAELLSLAASDTAQRPVLGRYTLSSLSAFTVTSMGATILSYALYVVAEHPGEDIHLLALTVPFVIFGVFRYYLLVETSELGDRPEEVLLRDRPIQVCVLGFAAVAVLALYLGP